MLLLLRGRGAQGLIDVLSREPASTPGPARAARDVDRPVLASVAYEAPLLPPPHPPPQPSGPLQAGTALPPPPGLPPDALALLVARAAARARALSG